MCYQNWVRSAVFTSVLLVFNFRQTAHYSCSTFMQNGQIPFPLHLLLPNPPLIWKSSAKSGKKSGKLGKQEIWFHAKMPNRPQLPSQQRCQGIFQRFRHIRVFSSAKNDALFARCTHTSLYKCPLLTTSQLSSSGLLKHHVTCQQDCFLPFCDL